MAGEKLGRAFELVTLVLLENAGYVIGEDVHWNVAPDQCSIDPDITIGDADRPEHIILVTSSQSANNSNMKTWRNLGEMFEAAKQTGCGSFVNVILEGGQDAGLQDLMSRLTRQIIVQHNDWGPPLIRAIRRLSEDIPRGRDSAIEFVRAWCNSHQEVLAPYGQLLSEAVESPTDDLSNAVVAAVSKIPNCTNIPGAKTTFLKRGVAKLLLFAEETRQELYASDEFLGDEEDLGFYVASGLLARRASGRFSVADRELRWLIRHYSGPMLEVLVNSLRQESNGLLDQYVTIIKGGGSLLTELIKDRWPELVTPEQLILLFDETTESGNCINLFWEIVELIRQSIGGDQSYGFAEIANDVGYTDGISSGYKHLSDWANGRPCRIGVSRMVLDVCNAICDRLISIGQETALSLCPKMIEAISKNTFEQKLVSYPKLEPIPLLILQHLSERSLEHVLIRRKPSLLGEVTGRPSSLTNQVIECKGRGICWKTGYPKGRSHKVKEAMGKGPSLFLTYSADGISPRYESGTILVLDGVFTQDDIRHLGQSGWLEIYWVDEIQYIGL